MFFDKITLGSRLDVGRRLGKKTGTSNSFEKYRGTNKFDSNQRYLLDCVQIIYFYNFIQYNE